MPMAWSTEIEPVEIASSASVSRCPRRMIAPLPNCLSICASVPSTAFKRSNFVSAMDFIRSFRAQGAPGLHCTSLPRSGGKAHRRRFDPTILEDVNAAVKCLRDIVPDAAGNPPRPRRVLEEGLGRAEQRKEEILLYNLPNDSLEISVDSHDGSHRRRNQ